MCDAPRGLKCPRCQLLLQQDEYEGHAVCFCTNCWGYWMPRPTFEAILQEHQYHFSRGERKTILQVLREQGDADRSGTESELIACPVCGAQMKRIPAVEGCPVMIDECSQHGVWLDTGELKELQVFVESRGR